MIGINLVAPKAGAKGELLFNKPASEEQSVGLKWYSTTVKRILQH
jgi:hypothetical protein